MANRLRTLVQQTAENYVEAQVVERRARTDRRFTEAQRRAALEGLRAQALHVAALCRLALDADKQSA